MKSKGLTAKQVEHMKPEKVRREIPAGPPAGLYLVVHPSGRKSWAFRYRFDGKPRKLTFKKAYPDLRLAQARAEAEAVADDVKSGIDPAEKETAENPKANAFEAVVSEFVERYAKRNRTWRETERLLQVEAVEAWKGRDVTEISRPDVLRVLDGIADRGAPIGANRTLAALRRFFAWAVERGLIEHSPVAGIRAPSPEKTRDRVLTPEELAEVWRAAGTLEYPTGQFVKLLLLTAQRRGEVAAMRWEQIDFDAALWSLPKEAVKAGRAHDVPLSSAAVALLESMPRWEGPFVFSTTSGQKPISGFSKMKARIDDAMLAARRKADPDADPIPRWTWHDLRRSAATEMAKANVAPHVLAAVLNHSPGQTLGISAVYIRHRFLQERREALEAWGQYVLELAEPRKEAAAL